MSNYTKATNFATKDALISGNPLKIVKGTEINTEFDNIQTAIATKADLASPTFTGTPTLPTGTIGVTQSSSNSSTALATTAFVQSVAQVLFPVGSIYSATVSTNPATLLGFGTWTAFGAGRMLISQDATYPAGATGGSATTTLITANLPSHSHSITDPTHTHTTAFSYVSNSGTGPFDANASGTPNNIFKNTVNSASTGITSTNATGSGTAVTTISPYIAVYIWTRTV